VYTWAVGGAKGAATAQSNYGYLDGHATTHAFGEVYVDRTDNRFNPETAR
jgi:prepilin-type processing-associated H-X9-DG protein